MFNFSVYNLHGKFEKRKLLDEIELIGESFKQNSKSFTPFHREEKIHFFTKRTLIRFNCLFAPNQTESQMTRHFHTASIARISPHWLASANFTFIDLDTLRHVFLFTCLLHEKQRGLKLMTAGRRVT